MALNTIPLTLKINKPIKSISNFPYKASFNIKYASLIQHICIDTKMLYLKIILNILNEFQERGEVIILRAEERLRHALVPQYQQLFRNISRQEGGVKFLVDMRADILVGTPTYI